MTALGGMRTARLAGFLLGAALAATLVLASRPASGGEAVGASVSFAAEQTGELATDPAGPAEFLHIGELRPGASAQGSFRMRNQTGRREAVRLHLEPSSNELDHILTVAVTSGGRTLTTGLIGSLPPAETVVLAPGDQRSVEVSASLAAGSDAEAAAALVEVAVSFEAGAPEQVGGIAPW